MASEEIVRLEREICEVKKECEKVHGSWVEIVDDVRHLKEELEEVTAMYRLDLGKNIN